MNGSCSKCNCQPCQCAPAVLNNPQIIGGVFDGPTVNGPTVNGGVLNQPNINGAQIDCTTRGCTQPTGICDASLATTAFTCTAISNAISGSNPAFCTAVNDCLVADPSALCPAVAFCIASTPGIIATANAFAPGARATTTIFGVMRYATQTEFNNGVCLVGIDPCTLMAFWNAPNLASPMWMAFQNAFNTAFSAMGGFCAAVDACLTTSPTLCAAVFACGAAPLNSPFFTGDPRVPTAAPGDNDNSAASTAFVNTAIGAVISGAISGSNPAFCAAVAACGGGGSGMQASGEVLTDGFGNFVLGLFINGATYGIFGGSILQINFNVAQPDTNYVILFGGASPSASGDGYLFKSTTGFSLNTSGGSGFSWAVFR